MIHKNTLLAPVDTLMRDSLMRDFFKLQKEERQQRAQESRSRQEEAAAYLRHHGWKVKPPPDLSKGRK
jgi:hypothetical protein